MIQDREKKVLDHIGHGISGLVPPFRESLWTQPVPEARPEDWYLDPASRHGRGLRRLYAAGTMAACAAVCLLSVLLFQVMPSASVYLDVNPSINLQVNYRNRVTTAAACNEDAGEILADMELRGADLDVAIYAILGSMVHHGYLTEATDTVLVSVHSANENRARELEMRVTDTVSQSLDKMIRAGEVLSQQLDGEDLEKADPDRDSTPGKDAFIEELEDRYPQLEDADLENLTMDEIVSLLEKQDLDYSDYVDDEDDDDDDDDGPDRDDRDEDDDDEDDGHGDGHSAGGPSGKNEPKVPEPPRHEEDDDDDDDDD